MRVRLGVNVSAPLMYGLSWILFGAAVLMIGLAIATALGVAWLPATPATDMIIAGICGLLALGFRSLGRWFEQPI